LDAPERALQARGSNRRRCDRMVDFDGLNGVIDTPDLLAAGKRHESG